MNAHQRAKEYMERKPLFLDTETTGLGPTDQVVEIAVLDVEGAVVLHSLVKPTVPIPAEATAIHGIRDEDVAEAPTFADIADTLYSLLNGANVVIYNADYDARMLKQSGAAHGLEGTGPKATTICAMRLYAEYRGEPGQFGSGFKWWKLEEAAKQCGIDFGKWQAHRALDDADITRALMVHMATHPLPVDASHLAGLMLEWEGKRKELDALEAEIRAAVLALGKTQTVGNVRASYTAGRKTYDYEAAVRGAAIPEDEWVTEVKVDWKATADAAQLVAPVKSQSEPSVTIKVLE